MLSGPITRWPVSKMLLILQVKRGGLCWAEIHMVVPETGWNPNQGVIR